MATRVSIKIDLERRLRKCAEQHELIAEVVALLDEVSKKRETGSFKPSGGLGYKELVSLLRFHLGSELVLPPAPDPTFIVRMVNTARQMGVREDNVEQIIRGLRRQYPRGPYQLDFILRRADVHYSAGEVDKETGRAVRGDEQNENGRVHTGRELLRDD